jgi:hypothetical protein
MADDKAFHQYPNSFAINGGYDCCWLYDKTQKIEWQNAAIKPTRNGPGDVVGCGLLVNPTGNEVSIFFTLNGLLIGLFPPLKSNSAL